MPIISFNISDSLKNFLKKMVNNKEYKNNSYVIRDALIRLMDEKATTTGDLDVLEETTFSQILPKISASIMITMQSHQKVDRKINRLEIQYAESILHKSSFVNQNIRTIMYILEDSMDNIQLFITELNSVEDLQSFRYVINEPPE